MIRAVINVPVDVRKWLFGDAVFDGSREGTYDFRVAMLDPGPANPPFALRLRIEIPTAGTVKSRFV
jgi:hypothetical protein